MKLLLSVILSVGFFTFLKAQCSTAGPFDAASFSNNTSAGVFSWSNPSNAALNDNVYATATQALGIFSTVNSNYLVATGFGFSISSTASICGIMVEVERSAPGIGIGSSIKDQSIKIVKGGVITGVDHAAATNWPSSEAYASYGNNADAWGTSWVPSDINAAGFGIAIATKLSSGAIALSLTPGVDHIRMTVYFNVALPVTLTSFMAKQISNRVNLQWTTSSETGNETFLLERSFNNSLWAAIDSVPAAANTGTGKIYSYDDYYAGPVDYYRLKQIDPGGRITISKTLKVSTTNNLFAGIKIYPDPVASKEFTIVLPGDHPANYMMRIIDQTGKTAYTTIINSINSDQHVKVVLNQQLPQGVYIVYINDVLGKWPPVQSKLLIL